MRTKRILGVVMLTALLILLSVALCACGGLGGSSENNKNNGTTNSGTQSSGNENAGWKNVQADNIYNALILGCTNVAYEGSAKSVSEKNGILTIDAKVKITMGSSMFWFTLLAKYKQLNPRESTMISMELATAEKATDESRIVSVHLYNDELYVAVGKDNKLKFPMSEVAWTRYFPYEMEQLTSTDIGSLSMALTSAMVTNTTNTAQYRRSEEGDEYHYTIDIDLDETITSLFAFLEKSSTKKIEMMEDIKKFVAVFFGVEEKDIVKPGSLPQSVLKLDFNTLNGKISQLKFDFDIDMHTSKLFSDGKMKGNVSIEKMQIGNNFAAVSVPFVNDSAEQEKYETFGNTIFTLKFPLTEYEDGQEVPDSTVMQITTKVFQGSGEDDFIFAEYKDASNREIKKGLYVYNNTAYFYSSGDEGYKCLCAFKIDDLGSLATKIVTNDLGGTGTFNPVNLLAYAINSMSLSSQDIKISLKPGFYKDVWYNFEDLCDYINTFTAVDLMEVDGIADFYNFVKTNEVIVTFETHITFLDVVDSSDQDVISVINMLGDVGEDMFLSARDTVE